jgi:pyruvate/2-oxoglutarate/acetoin dehydrogenase E1 component
VCITVSQRCRSVLTGQIVRVAARDVPVPSSGPLEQRVIPQLADIVEGCLNCLQLD